jgi:hypothetical protein
MKTSLQTVEIEIPNTTLEHSGLELLPILPEEYSLEYEVSIHIKSSDGSHTSWFNDGTVTRESQEGVCRIWQPRPTIKDAISYSQTDGSVFIFKNDDIECRWGGMNYYWSAPIYEATPVEGVRVYYCQECDGETPQSDNVCIKCRDALYRDYYRFGY